MGTRGRRRSIGRALLVLALCLSMSAPPVPVAASPESPEPVRAEESDRRLVRSGAWVNGTSSATSGGGYAYSSRAGSSLTMHFRGTQVAWVAPVGPGYGRAEVYLNGRLMNRVDLYAPDAAHQRTVWSMSGLADTSHTLTIRVLGQKHAASTGGIVIVDALDVVSETGATAEIYGARVRAEESDRRLVRSGAWVNGTSSATSGGGYAYSSRAGSSLTMHFRGTQVAWVAPVGPGYGRAEVYLNGRLMNRVDLYAPDAAHQRTVWSMSGLADTSHTLTIRVLGQKHAASSGAIVIVDALDVVSATGSTAAVEDPRVLHRHPWSSYIVIDKSDFRLYWYRNGRLSASYPIAHARVGAVTPNGVWRVGSKYLSDPGGIYGPRKMRLYRQYRRADGSTTYLYTRYLIHGTNNPASIGTRASAGCIRMYNSDVLRLFPEVPVGTMVVVQD